MKDNDLKIGDVCVFEQINKPGISFKVVIYRDRQLSSSSMFPGNLKTTFTLICKYANCIFYLNFFIFKLMKMEQTESNKGAMMEFQKSTLAMMSSMVWYILYYQHVLHLFTLFFLYKKIIVDMFFHFISLINVFFFFVPLGSEFCRCNNKVSENHFSLTITPIPFYNKVGFIRQMFYTCKHFCHN